MQNAGNVYKSAKTKIYKDGSTNTVVCRSPIFKDTDIISSERLKVLQFIEKFDSDRGERLVNFLHENQLSFTDMLQYFKGAEREFLSNFPNFPECIGISKNDWFDFCKPYAEKKHEKRVLKEPRYDSLKRAKDSIFDLVLCNDFQYFFTGTIDPKKIDSSSPDQLITPVTEWLSRLRKGYGAGYIVVAERHKKGGIHFHGLLKSEKPLALVDSGTKLYEGHKRPVSAARACRLGLTGGRTVYNLKTWRFGFSTAIELIGDPLYTAFYVTKYITKESAKIFGRFFWHSRNLEKPKIIIHDLDFDSIEKCEFNGFKYIFERGNNI